MDLEKYISSGILETYALDELSAKEREGVFAMIQEHPELQAELDLIEKSLEDLAMNSSVEMPAELKDSIFSKIDSSLKLEDKAEETPVIDLKPKANPQLSSSIAWKYIAAASIAGTLFTSYMAYDYQTKLNSVEKSKLELKASQVYISNLYKDANARLNKLESDAVILSSVNYKQVSMLAIDTSSSIAAKVYWNNKTQETFLHAGSLKELPSEKQYQLWAIVDGKPVDVGIFDSKVSTLIPMKQIEGASMFAVTIEEKGGSTVPSLETMQVAGQVI